MIKNTFKQLFESIKQGIKMAQAFWDDDENKQQEWKENEYLLKKDVNTAYIRYNVLPDEVFFLKLEYDGGDITFTIDKIGYKVSVNDYDLGNFTLVNPNIDNSNFSQQIMKIFNEFGNSVNLEYIKHFSKININGKEIKVDNNKMKNLIGKLFHTTLSYIKNNFSTYHFTQNIDKIFIRYTYVFRNPELDGYVAFSPEYIYDVSYTSVNSLSIYKTQSDGKAKRVFQIFMGLHKYSRRILSDVINLVLQSKIKTNEYGIEIEGENVTINNKSVKVDRRLVKDTTDAVENQIRYVIDTVKNKLDMLEQDFLSS